MSRRPRRRPSAWRVGFLVILIGVLLYVNQVVVPATPPLFVPTPTPTTSPESFINQGQELFREGKLTLAIDAYKNAISVDPGNPAVYIELARLQIFSGAYDEAIINTQNALLKNPDSSLAHAVQGWALMFQEKYGEAELEIRKALDLDPNSALAHAFYAELLANQLSTDYGLLDKAIAESKLARDLGPELLETHRARGIVLYNTTNHEEAVQEFQAALAINKNIPDLHLYLGLAYQALQRYDLAQESLQFAYSLNPQDPVALIELSSAFFADGRFAQASQYAEEAVKVDPSNPRLRAFLGITYYKQKQYDKAIPQLALAVRGGTAEDGAVVEGIPLSYDPRVMEYYWYYGFAMGRSGRCAEAVPVFQALLQGVPDNEIAVYNATVGIEECTGGGDTETEAASGEETPEVTSTPES